MVKSLLFEVCTLMTVQVNSKNKSTGDDAFAFYNYEKADNQSIFFWGLLLERIMVNRQMEPMIVRVRISLDPLDFD